MKHYNYSKAKDNYYSLTVKHITITATLGSLILSLPSFFFFFNKKPLDLESEQKTIFFGYKKITAMPRKC